MKLEAIVAGLEDLPLGSRTLLLIGEGARRDPRVLIGKKLRRRRRS